MFGTTVKPTDLTENSSSSCRKIPVHGFYILSGNSTGGRKSFTNSIKHSNLAFYKSLIIIFTHKGERFKHTI